MQDKKNIWIVNQYAGTPQTGNPGRHVAIAKVLKRLGFNVTIITASFTHKRMIETGSKSYLTQTVNGIDYMWIKVPKYSNLHGLGRIYNWLVFAFKIANLKPFDQKPDFIYYSSLSLIGYLGAEKLKYKFNIPLIFEVRDIWPLTLKQFKSLSSFHPLVFLLKIIENRAYKNSDIITSNLSNFKQYLKEETKRIVPYYWIPNGFDSHISIDSNPAYLHLPYNSLSSYKIGYTGSLGLANKMDIFIKAANLLANEDIEFYILGDGPLKRHLQNMSSNTNIHFLDPIPKSKVQDFLHSVDCCYIGWNDSLLYQYGIGANKIVDYLQAKKPIIHSYSGLGDPVSLFNVGITIPSEDIIQLKNAILEVKSYNHNKISEIESNCSSALANFYDYSMTLLPLVNQMLKLEKSKLSRK